MQAKRKQLKSQHSGQGSRPSYPNNGLNLSAPRKSSRLSNSKPRIDRIALVWDKKMTNTENHYLIVNNNSQIVQFSDRMPLRLPETVLKKQTKKLTFHN